MILNDYHNFIINGESYQPPVGVNLVFHYRNRLRRGCSQACFLTISNFSMDAVHDERISRKFCSIRQRSHRSHHRLAFRKHSAICYGLYSHIQGTAAWRILTNRADARIHDREQPPETGSHFSISRTSDSCLFNQKGNAVLYVMPSKVDPGHKKCAGGQRTSGLSRKKYPLSQVRTEHPHMLFEIALDLDKHIGRRMVAGFLR